MPKRLADDRCGCRAAKLPRRRRRHLYLVLDDWEKGYSIHKLDLSSDPDAAAAAADDEPPNQPPAGDGAGDITTEQRLPSATFRIEAPRGFSGLFTAFGTKIMATHRTPRRAAPMFDVRTRVDGKLLLLDHFNSAFQMLVPPPPETEPNVELLWEWGWLPAPPFRHYVVAHAVHPDGSTVFFSAQKAETGRRRATFSFDVKQSKWTRRGAWRLPFGGRGYYDGELDAWVGLSGDPDSRGHLCACEVVSSSHADDHVDDGQPPAPAPAPPAWKLSKEKLFCVDPAEKHIGATLVYMGGRGEFCLVQCLSMDDRDKEDVWEEFLPHRLRFLLRVTTFFLKYDKNGDLRTAHRRVRSYRLPKAATLYSDDLETPVAFWM
ncbi:hypothetical protein ACP4OV_006468 [Aristida adscensionis]